LFFVVIFQHIVLLSPFLLLSNLPDFPYFTLERFTTTLAFDVDEIENPIDPVSVMKIKLSFK